MRITGVNLLTILLAGIADSSPYLTLWKFKNVLHVPLRISMSFCIPHIACKQLMRDNIIIRTQFSSFNQPNFIRQLVVKIFICKPFDFGVIYHLFFYFPVFTLLFLHDISDSTHNTYLYTCYPFLFAVPTAISK